VIKNSEELKAWLQKRPAGVPVAFAARASLRVLPFVQEALHYKLNDLVLRVFGNLAFAWAGARYAIRTEYASPTIDIGHISLAPSASDAAFAAHAAAAHVRDAAYTVVAVATAANAASLASAAFWSTVSIDATRMEEGAAASDVAGSPLWPQPEGQPDWLRSLWQEMKAALHAEKQNWQVWTTWYDDQLDGRVRDEERELAYVRIEEALWDQGPAVVNAEIKRLIEEPEPPQSHTQEPKRSPVGLSLRDGFSIPGQSHTKDPEPFPVPEIPAALPAPIDNVPSAVSFGLEFERHDHRRLGSLELAGVSFQRRRERSQESSQRPRGESAAGRACKGQAMSGDTTLDQLRKKLAASRDSGVSTRPLMKSLPKHGKSPRCRTPSPPARCARPTGARIWCDSGMPPIYFASLGIKSTIFQALLFQARNSCRII
jgi:hypothetical protein